MLELLATSAEELCANPIYQGFNDRGLVDTTRESTLQNYMTVGYKWTGIETIGLVSLFSDADLTCLLSNDIFDNTTDLPVALDKQAIYEKLRAAFEDTAKCTVFLEKWRKFKPHFSKFKDNEDKLNRRNKMFVPWSGQNRVNAAGRFGSVEEGDPIRFAAMQRWTYQKKISCEMDATKP